MTETELLRKEIELLRKEIELLRAQLALKPLTVPAYYPVYVPSPSPSINPPGWPIITCQNGQGISLQGVSM